MSRFRFLLLIAVALGGLFGAAQWQRGHEPGDEGDVVAAAAPRPERAASAAAVPASAASATPPDAALAASATMPGRARSIPNIGAVEAFGPVSWLPPVKVTPVVVAAPPPPPPPPPPTAPKLPFALMGMVERGSLTPQAYLAKGDTLLIVSAGEVIDNNTYRVESLQPNSVVLTYLPLGIKQTLNAPGVTP